VQTRHLVAAGFGCALAAGAIFLAPTSHHANLSAATAELQEQPPALPTPLSSGASRFFTKNLQAYLPPARNPNIRVHHHHTVPMLKASPTPMPTWTPTPTPRPAPTTPPPTQSATATWQPPNNDPVGMSEGQVAAYWLDNGGSTATVNDAVCIAWYESRWQVDAISPTNDVGLWQINFANAPSGDSWQQFVSLLEDPDTNAQFAVRLSGGGSNWSPWTTAGDCGL
jgi:Lysozyme like domain